MEQVRDGTGHRWNRSGKEQVREGRGGQKWNNSGMEQVRDGTGQGWNRIEKESTD